MEMVIINGKIFPMEGNDIGNGYVRIKGTKICRVDSRVGSLKAGKDADIAIFSGNPLEVFTKTMYTIINGEIVYKDES